MNDGVPGCKVCKGQGSIDLPPDPSVGRITPSKLRCDCVLKRDLLLNLRRGWRGLERADNVKKTPLKGRTGDNLRVTGSLRVFRAHLRHVALRMGSTWNFQVSSDADLMSAWLANIHVGGGEVYDVDVRKREIVAFTLEDLIDPPELLIIFLGVKAARNSAMPEVLLETVQHRQYRDKATWIVDQPHALLDAEHIAYSEGVRDVLLDWEHIELDDEGLIPTKNKKKKRKTRKKSQPAVNGTGRTFAPTRNIGGDE